MVGGGCAMFSGKDPMMQVKESQLNWLEVRYLPGLGQPAVQFSMMGTGLIRIKRGNSPLVTNDFARDVANHQWGDIQTDQINVPSADIHRIFQSLVDRGLLREPDKDFASFASRGVSVAHISGTLNNTHVARIAVEPELVGFIREMLKLFDDRKPAGEKN